MKKIYVTGISGTGKSSIGEELSKRNIACFDIDRVDGLCSWKNKETSARVDYVPGASVEWLEANDWICDVEKLKKLMDVKEEMVAVVGISANQNEYLSLFDKVFVLQCSKETLLDRLTNRTQEGAFGRAKSEQDYLFSWYKNFENDLISKGAKAINSEAPIQKVAEEILLSI